MSTSVATILATTRTVVKYGKIVYEYVQTDQGARLGLLKPVSLTIEGPGVGIGNFIAIDGLFDFHSPTINKVEFNVIPFPANADSPWNGPDGIPNTWKGGSVPSSLFHDFICLNCSAISLALNITEDEMWEWASGILSTSWEHYGHYTPRAQGESWLAYYITRYARRPYAWVKRKLGFLCIVIAAVAVTGCTGCPPSNLWRVTSADPVLWVEDGITTTNTPPVSAP